MGRKLSRKIGRGKRRKGRQQQDTDKESKNSGQGLARLSPGIVARDDEMGPLDDLFNTETQLAVIFYVSRVERPSPAPRL